MLVLSRFREERLLMLGPDGQTIATITIVDVRPNGQVRVGFEADRSINIVREELMGRPPRGERRPQ